MIKAVLYDETGDVVSAVEMPSNTELPNGPELWGLQVGVLPTDESYVEGGYVKPSQDYTLSNLPLPCVVEIEGVQYPVAEQPVFTFDAPGTYLIRVDAGPKYKRKEFEFEHTDQP